MSSYSVTGLKELEAKLMALSQNVAKKKLRNAVNAGAKPVLKKMRELAPVKHDIGGQLKAGQLRKDLRVSTRANVAKGSVTAKIGPSKRTAFVANWLERGAAPHDIAVSTRKVLSNERVFFGKRTKHPGISPRPFIRPALDMTQAQAIDALKAKLAQGVEEVAQGK